MNSLNYNAIPASPGVYMLHLILFQPQRIQIGKLGEAQFLPGNYLYVGSARGSGGLRSRLGRHLMGNGIRHWHIDWLRTAAIPEGYFFLETNKPMECAWYQAILQLPDASVPVPGFGSSDCRGKGKSCAAHLVSFGSELDVNLIRNILPADDGSEAVYRRYMLELQPEIGDIE